MSAVSDRIRGCILGGALGDAIGLFTEFMDHKQCIAQYGADPKFKLLPPAPPGYVGMLRDRHRALFEVASWTDDTDQSLLILMSFLHNGGRTPGIDVLDFAARLKHWTIYGFRPMDTWATDIGMTVDAVTNEPDFAIDPYEASTRVWESHGRYSAANGAVMRTSVVGALFYKDMDILYSTSINLARCTHADPRCLVSCTIASALVAAAIRNEIHSDQDIRRVVDAAITPVTQCNPPLSASQIDELHTLIWKDSLEELELDGHGIGYTYKCLASGVWALRQGLAATKSNNINAKESLTSAIERIITKLTMAGGDGDTNCAVAGSLLGALFGYSNLPSEWLQDLKHHDWLLSKADAAIYLTTGEGAPYSSENDPDNLIDGGKGL